MQTEQILIKRRVLWRLIVKEFPNCSEPKQTAAL